MAYCVVESCGATSGTLEYSDVSFHRFPKSDIVRKMWLDNLQKKNLDGSPWQPRQASVMCSQHFVEACFRRKTKKSNYRRLLSYAYPTKRMDVPNYWLKHRSFRHLSIGSSSNASGDGEPAMTSTTAPASTNNDDEPSSTIILLVEDESMASTAIGPNDDKASPSTILLIEESAMPATTLDQSSTKAIERPSLSGTASTCELASPSTATLDRPLDEPLPSTTATTSSDEPTLSTIQADEPSLPTTTTAFDEPLLPTTLDHVSSSTTTPPPSSTTTPTMDDFEVDIKPDLPVIHPDSLSVVLLDHPYALNIYKSPKEVAKETKELQERLSVLVKEKSRLQTALTKANKQVAAHEVSIRVLKQKYKKYLPYSNTDNPFKGRPNLPLAKKGTQTSFSKSVKHFAMTVYYHSPKAYQCLAKSFSLPTATYVQKAIRKARRIPECLNDDFQYVL